jgi:hypothetical protein
MGSRRRDTIGGLLIIAVLVAIPVLWFALRPDGDQSTDEHAERIAADLERDRYDSATRVARAVLAGDQAYGVSVLEATDLVQGKVETRADGPMARLVIRIHEDAYDAYFGRVDEITACYELEFDYYGRTDGPDRVHCPDTAPIDPPAAPVFGEKSFTTALTKVLDALPDDPSADGVRTELAHRELISPVDSSNPVEPGLTAEVRTAGADVAVAFQLFGTCVLGTRIDHRVQVDHGCDPAAALAGR